MRAERRAALALILPAALQGCAASRPLCEISETRLSARVQEGKESSRGREIGLQHRSTAAGPRLDVLISVSSVVSGPEEETVLYKVSCPEADKYPNSVMRLIAMKELSKDDRTDTRLTGKSAEERRPLAGFSLNVAFTANDDAGRVIKTQTVPVAPTGADGKTTVELRPFLRALPRPPHALVVEARLADEPATSGKLSVEQDELRPIVRLIEEERAADSARAKGDSAAGAERLSEALEQYSRAYALLMDHEGLDDKRSQVWKKLAGVYVALPRTPEVPEAVVRLLVQSEALAGSEEYARAIGLLDTAVRMAPWVPPARFNRAMLYAHRRDFRAAIGEMELYLQLAADAPNAREARNKIYQWEINK